MTWDASQTRRLVEKLFGREQLAIARGSIKSIIDRLDYARYHYQEAVRLQKHFCEEHLSDELLIAVAFSSEDKERLAFEVLMMQLGAHTVACVQSIHTLPDILAHVLYLSLGLNNGQSTALREQQINADTVDSLLQAFSGHAELRGALRCLTGQGSFNHVAALSNHSKHRSIVQPLLSEDHTGLREERHEVRFAAFTYKGTVYPEVSVSALLSPEYARCSRVVVDAGRNLNVLLEEMLRQRTE